MAYRIDYGPPMPRRRGEKFPLRLPLLTCVFFLLFLLVVKAAWPAGSEKLTQLLLPAQAAAESQEAVQAFLSDLKEGEPFYESQTAFCQQIIAYADIPTT